MKSTIFGIGVALALTAQAALAQDATYIQIEAQPSLSRAEDRVRDYASYLSDVNGFALGAGWYGIALGPYSRAEAQNLMRRLRSNGQIPRDSYVEEDERYRQRFYPVGAAAAATEPEPTGSEQTASEPQAEDAPADRADVPAEPQRAPEESPREARASEAQLGREARMELQVALKWAGHYDGPIDAAFGQGTRGAMASWQEANNYEASGVLTTRQRTDLIAQYNAVLEGLEFARVEDARAGIAIEMPTALVEFEGADSPFVRYGPTGEPAVRVLLISQPGDSRTLAGLYEIMQTLEIVPPEGPRQRQGDRFTLEGRNARTVSFTEARLSEGAIKGFSLIWPAGDEARRTRVLARMRQSFAPLPGQVLDAATLSEDAQAVDLISGLEVRRPRATASGFYVDRSGAVLTALGAVDGCGRVTLEDTFDARIVAQDAELGAAVLRPDAPLRPREVASFRSAPVRLRSEVAVSGYPFGGVLTAPTLTFGMVEDVRGLDGEDRMKRLALAAQPGDAGGPVLDTGGAVMGMLLPRQDADRQLPDSVSFAADASRLRALLTEAGVESADGSAVADMAPEDLTEVAADLTVLVSCWE